MKFLRINYLRKNLFYDLPIPQDIGDVKRGDFVILAITTDGDERLEAGKIVFIHDLETVEKHPPKLVRKATDEDVQKIFRLQEEEKQAFATFIKKIATYNLAMQPVGVFFAFDERHADFVYTAEERVDFRELVKDLASTFRKKIFLEQVSTRDRAGLADGCGSCGRKLCCSTFLRDRPPVTMTAVRGQDLYYRDRDKLTGLCGKLKCCLNYELDVYEELAKAFPPMKAKITVTTTGKRGIVIGRSVLDQLVRVAYEEEGLKPEMIALTHIAFTPRKDRS